MDEIRRHLEHIRDSGRATPIDPSNDRYTLVSGDLCISWNTLAYEIKKCGELVYRSEQPDSRGDKEPYLVPGDWLGEVQRLALRA